MLQKSIMIPHQYANLFEFKEEHRGADFISLRLEVHCFTLILLLARTAPQKWVDSGMLSPIITATLTACPLVAIYSDGYKNLFSLSVSYSF